MGKNSGGGVGNHARRWGIFERVEHGADEMAGYEQGIQLRKREIARERKGGIELSRFPQS
jgi:hypothetical protein